MSKAFVDGYIEAAFFCDAGPDSEELQNLTSENLSGEAWEKIKEDCEDFVSSNRELLQLAYSSNDYDEAQAGRDFWFTRNGHGVGFWDRGQLQKDSRDALTVMAKAYGSTELYLTDTGEVNLY